MKISDVFILLSAGLLFPAGQALPDAGSSKKCGVYRAVGTLLENPWRVVVKKGAADEVSLNLSKDCGRCPYFSGLAVRASIEITSLHEDGKLLNMVAITSGELFGTQKPIELQKKLPCK